MDDIAAHQFASRMNERLRLADEAANKLSERLRRAIELLREWRDKYGGKEHYKFAGINAPGSASPTDLVRDTTRFLEGR